MCGRMSAMEEEDRDAVIQINVNNGPFTNGHVVMKTVSIDCMLSLYHIGHTPRTYTNIVTVTRIHDRW